MKFYEKFAGWWPLFSAPGEYEEEAGLFLKIIGQYGKNIRTALELGSGGGNNALYFKKYFRMTLTDISSGMLEISRQLNPECEHIQADMRDMNLGKAFDLVFVHDAIMYMTSREDLERVFEVASRHLKNDGILFIAPDFFRETFKPSTSHGGHDGNGRSLRYLEWTTDRNPHDDKVETDYVFVLKNSEQTEVFHDQAEYGIFSKAVWQKLLEKAGFSVSFMIIDHSELEPESYVAIIGKKNPDDPKIQ